MCLTFYNFLWVIKEELAEWGSFGPFECVQQLLDLSGHPAVDRHAWTNIKNSHRHKRTEQNNTCNSRLTQITTMSDALTQALRTSRIKNKQQEEFKNSKGKWHLSRNTVDNLKENQMIGRFFMSRPTTRDKHKDRETDTRLESKLILASSASLPFPKFDIYYLFSFLY